MKESVDSNDIKRKKIKALNGDVAYHKKMVVTLQNVMHSRQQVELAKSLGGDSTIDVSSKNEFDSANDNYNEGDRTL